MEHNSISLRHRSSDSNVFVADRRLGMKLAAGFDGGVPASGIAWTYTQVYRPIH